MNTQAEGATAADDPWFGRMNDPTAAASIQGLCGDDLEEFAEAMIFPPGDRPADEHTGEQS